MSHPMYLELSKDKQEQVEHLLSLDTSLESQIRADLYPPNG